MTPPEQIRAALQLLPTWASDEARDAFAALDALEAEYARAEEALRTCTTFSALARAYFAGEK